MKCKVCKTEMLVDKAVENADKAVVEVHYKCPNKQCSEWGYKNVPQSAEG